MQPGEWEDRLLYSLFIGKRRDEVEIPAAEFDLALKSLTDRIKTTLGAYTRVRFIEAEGETLTWGQEPTALVLVIADVAQKNLADAAVTDTAARLAEDLSQDAIWITRLRLDLFVAQRMG